MMRLLMMEIWAVTLVSGYCALLPPGPYRRYLVRRAGPGKSW